MLHAAYIAGWERRRFSVFGRELVPLTLGHARVLYIAESPIVKPGKQSAEVSDILTAVCVCAMPIPPQANELDVIAKQAEGFDRFDIKDELVKFRKYVDYYCKPIPRFSDSKEPARTPWPWALVAMLERYYGYTEASAWMELVATAFWKMAAVAVQNGSKDYATLDEMELPIWNDQ